MKVTILMADGSLKEFNDARRVTNASTRIPVDYLAVWRVFDHPDRPSVHIPMKDVVCVEVVAVCEGRQ